MWGEEDSVGGFMFPPMLYDRKCHEIEMPRSNRHEVVQHQFRGGRRGNGYKTRNIVSNKQFYCDTCDRAFDSNNCLEEHFAQHKTCGWDGCTFQAHYKIVELHIKMQHETGFAEKIMLLNTPEEIEKWKNDRKRNYPTAENVARRQAEQMEKTKRGEVIPSKDFGKFQRNGKRPFERNGSNRGRDSWRMNNGSDHYASGRGGGRRQRKKKRPSNDNPNTNVPLVGADYFGWKEDNDINGFAGTGITNPAVSNIIKHTNGHIKELCKDDSDPITDSDDETTASTEQAIFKHQNEHIPKALENLLTAYPSESEEETNATPIAKQSVENYPKAPKHPVENYPKTPIQQRNQPQNKFTLLEMLLAKEIQQERNKIFQCIRYIVQNDFFGIH